jgi:hypothetical protein
MSVIRLNDVRSPQNYYHTTRNGVTNVKYLTAVVAIRKIGIYPLT